MPANAGPYVPQEPSPIQPASSVELLFILLTRDVDRTIVPATQPVWVGGADNASQQAGCVVISKVGVVTNNPHLPIDDDRLQVRCMHHQYANAEQIGQHVLDLLHVRHRELVTQESSGHTYLIHRTQRLAGPTMHWDSETTWESLAFYEVMCGSYPVS